jgi:hypothetical protein
MNEYQELKFRLRIAKIEAANIPGGSTVGNGGLQGGPVDRHQRRLKRIADAKVRDAAKALYSYRHRHAITPVEFTRPVAGKTDWRDARIRRQYIGSPGWDHVIGVRFDEHGPYYTCPAVTENAVAVPPTPAVADDPQPSCPAAIDVAPAVTAPDLNPPGLSVENQDTSIPSNEVTPMTQLRTIGQLAKELRVDQHQALYLIRTRKIQPVTRAGAYRLFDTAAVKRIASELKQIASER